MLSVFLCYDTPFCVRVFACLKTICCMTDKVDAEYELRERNRLGCTSVHPEETNYQTGTTDESDTNVPFALPNVSYLGNRLKNIGFFM